MLIQWILAAVVKFSVWKYALAGFYVQRDLLFIADGHHGVHPAEFQIQNGFFKDLHGVVRSVGECGTKAALMQYSDRVSVEWDFNSPEASNRSQFEDEIMSVAQLGGPVTSLASVLNRASDVFNNGGGREGIAKLVVLFNVGRAQNEGNLTAAAEKLQKIARIAMILVGSDADLETASQITTDLFSVNNFEELQQVIHDTRTIVRECDGMCAQGFVNKAILVEKQQHFFRTFNIKLSNGKEKAVDLTTAPLKVSKRRQFCIETVNLERKFYLNSVCLDTTNIRQVKITGTDQEGKEILTRTHEIATWNTCPKFPNSEDDLQLITRLCFAFLPIKSKEPMEFSPFDIDTCLQTL